MTEPINIWGALRRSWRLLVVLVVVGAIVAVVIPVKASKPKGNKFHWLASSAVGALPPGGIGASGINVSTILLYANNFFYRVEAIDQAGMSASALQLTSQMTAGPTTYAAITSGDLQRSTSAAAATAKSAKSNTSNLVALIAPGATPADAVKLTNTWVGVVESAVNTAWAQHLANATGKNASASTSSGFTVLLPALTRNATRSASGGSSTLISKKVRLVLGLVLGLLLGAAIVLLRELLDKRMHRSSQSKNHFQYPVVAEIPQSPDLPHGDGRPILEVVDEPGGKTAEIYRKLRMSVLFENLSIGGTASENPFGMSLGAALPEPYKAPDPSSRQVVLVVSAGEEPTRPLVVANLGAAYAEAGQRVIVVTTNDLDTGPRAHERRSVSGPVTSVDVQTELCPTNLEDVSTLSLRAFVRNSGQLVNRAGDVFTAARELADVVIVESPPLIEYHHGEALLHAVDLVLVVAEYRCTTTTDADEAGAVLRKLGAPVLGIVFTNVPQSKKELQRRQRLGGAARGGEFDGLDGEADEADGVAPTTVVPRSVPEAIATNGSLEDQSTGTQVRLPSSARQPMLVAATHLASNPLTALLVAAILFGVSRPIIQRVAIAEANPWLVKILTASLILHLLAAPAQIFVVDHFYHGIADWIRYDTQGSLLAPGFRALNFSLAGANVRGIVNDGSVSIAAGIVMAIVGANQVATFLVFSWLSFLGTVLFYRAFTLTFPGVLAGHRRYALMLFFLPSMIFWTADVSKEAIMMLSLGVASYGAAKVLVRRRGGFTLLAVGVAIGILIRPNELLVMLGGFAVALMVRPPDPEQVFSRIKRIGGLAFMSVLLGLAVFLTLHYLHSKGGSLSLQQTAANNQGTGAGFGSSGVAYSTSPATYWRDVYTVLFDPLPINAHGMGELIASLENMVIIGLILISLRNLRMAFRAAFARPYVMLCLVYSLGFIYAFAALGNLGLIERERTMLFPFFLVLLCIPRTPRGRPAVYEWEYRRRRRKELLAMRRYWAERGLTLDEVLAYRAAGLAPPLPGTPAGAPTEGETRQDLGAPSP